MTQNQWEKNYQSVCALGIVHRGWEEDMKGVVDPQCSHRCSKVYGHMLVQGETGLTLCFYFFNSRTAVLGIVPYIDRFVITLIGA